MGLVRGEVGVVILVLEVLFLMVGFKLGLGNGCGFFAFVLLGSIVIFLPI